MQNVIGKRGEAFCDAKAKLGACYGTTCSGPLIEKPLVDLFAAASGCDWEGASLQTVCFHGRKSRVLSVLSCEPFLGARRRTSG